MTVQRINNNQWRVWQGAIRLAIVTYSKPAMKVERGVLSDTDIPVVMRLIDAAIRQEAEQREKREVMRGGL